MEVLQQKKPPIMSENRPPSSKPGSSLPPISNKSVAQLIREKRRIESAASKGGMHASRSIRTSGRVLAGLAMDESSQNMREMVMSRGSSAGSSRVSQMGFGAGDLLYKPEPVKNQHLLDQRKKRAKE